MKHFRKFCTSIVFSLALTLLSPTILPISSQTRTIDAAAIKISKTKATVYVGNQYKLKVTGTSNYIMWKSSDKKVATVSSKGIISGIKEGTATITATIGSGSNNKKLTCIITVKSRLNANKKNVFCTLGEYEDVIISLKNERKNESLAFSVSDTRITDAEWDENSNEYKIYITPNEIGKTVIEFFTTEGSGLYQKFNTEDTIAINVYVLEDNSGWISETALKKYGVSIYRRDASINISYNNDDSITGISSSYTLDNINSELTENNNYESNSINYKYSGGKLFFKVSDLIAAKII